MKPAIRNLLAIVLAAAIGLFSIVAYGAPLTQTPPAWVMPGAVYDLDFANRRFYSPINVWMGNGNNGPPNNYTGTVFQAGGSSVAQTSFFTPWKDGIVRSVGAQSNMPRFSDYGLWIEGGPGGSNNFALRSRDFTQSATWTLTSITATKTSIVGADASTGNASQLTATGANGTALQTLVVNGKIDSNYTQTVTAGGTGYATNDILTVTGGTCGTAPQLKVTAQTGGVITAVSVQTSGSCTVLPASPVSVSGGAGTGATFTPFWHQGTTSAWIKCITCTGNISLTMDNGATWTDIHSQLNTSSFTHVRIPTQNLINNVVGIKISNSSDVIVADFFQTEDDDQATSPILTTTATVKRGPENVFFGTNSSNFNGGFQIVQNLMQKSPITIMFTYSGNFNTTLRHTLMSMDNPINVNSIGGGSSTISFGIQGASTSVTSTDSDVTGLFTTNKAIMRADGTGGAICINGGTLTKNTTLTTQPTISSGTHFNLLNNGANILPTNGYISRLTIWRSAVPDGKMVEYSTIVNGQ